MPCPMPATVVLSRVVVPRGIPPSNLLPSASAPRSVPAGGPSSAALTMVARTDSLTWAIVSCSCWHPGRLSAGSGNYSRCSRGRGTLSRSCEWVVRRPLSVLEGLGASPIHPVSPANRINERPLARRADVSFQGRESDPSRPAVVARISSPVMMDERGT